MPPKNSVTSRAPTTVKAGVRVKLVDVSLNPSFSGWREPDPLRQGQLRATFLEGGFGISIFGRVQLLWLSGKAACDQDGLQLIDDGFQTVLGCKLKNYGWRREFVVFIFTVFLKQPPRI